MRKKSKKLYNPLPLPLGMRELPPRSSIEQVNKRIQAVADGHSLTPLSSSVHSPKDHCIMPMHKGNYQVVTDPKLIPLMGKKP